MRVLTSSPHIHSGESTQRIMLDVCIALMPTTIWGIVVFGLRSLLVVSVSVLASVLTEYLLGKISKENTIWDLSAVVTGLLVGLNMPSTIPLFVPVLASAFAIAVCKWTFGGLGANWVNPAIAGRVFVFFSFTTSMSDFTLPSTLVRGDAVLTASASPLSFIKTLVSSGTYKGMTSLEMLAAENFPISAFAEKLSASIGINPYLIDGFVGNVQGCIGEVSALMLIIGAIYLFIRKVITWDISLVYLASFSIFTWIFGGLPNGLGLFQGEVFASLCRGGLILAAFYMATDMVTTPYSVKGHVIYASGCGILTFLFRTFGSLPEAASVAILIMNIINPTIDKFCKPVIFGSKEKLEEVKK